MRRRIMLGAAAGLIGGSGLARAQQPHHGAPIPSDRMAPLRGDGPVALSPAQYAQRFVDSTAPAGPAGRWVERATLPIPRTEMAWAAESGGKLHVIGGYAEQRVNNNYHHVYDPATDGWAEKARLPLAGTAAASDAFFPFRDGVDEIAKAGATAVVQPGGSVRDEEVIAAANEHNLAMVFTGVRHFRH